MGLFSDLLGVRKRDRQDQRMRDASFRADMLVDQSMAYSSILRYGGTNKSWQIEAGQLHANSTVGAVLSTILAKVGQSKPIAGSYAKSGEWTLAERETNDLQILFNNSFGAAVFEVLAASLKLYGMAYLVKIRENSTVIAYVPFMHPQVVFDPIGGRARYKVYKHGGSYKHEYFDEEDVIVMRDGIPDPKNPLVWQSPLMVTLREISADNEISTFIASVLANMGFSSAIISPESPIAQGQQSNWRKNMTEAFASFTRDRRGTNLVSPEAIKVTQIGFHPSQMQLIEFSKLSIAKICSAMGVDPLVVSLPTDNKTFNNYETSRKALILDCVVPLYTIILDAIKPHLVIDRVWRGAGVSRLELIVDKDQYEEIKDDRFKVSQDVRDNFRAGVLTRGEAREAMGYKTDTKDTRLFQEILGSMKGTAASSSTANALGVVRSSERIAASDRLRLEKLHEMDVSEIE